MRTCLLIICVSVLIACAARTQGGENATERPDEVAAQFQDGGIPAAQAEERLLRIVRRLPDGIERDRACRALAGVVLAQSGSLRETELRLLMLNALDGVRKHVAANMESLRTNRSPTVKTEAVGCPAAGQVAARPVVPRYPTLEARVERIPVSRAKAGIDAVRPGEIPRVLSAELAVPVAHLSLAVTAANSRNPFGHPLEAPVFRVSPCRANVAPVSFPAISQIRGNGKPKRRDKRRKQDAPPIRVAHRGLAVTVVNSRNPFGHPLEAPVFRVSPCRANVAPVSLPAISQVRGNGKSKRWDKQRKQDALPIRVAHTELGLLLALMERELDPGKVDSNGARRALGVCARVLATPVPQETRDAVVFKAWAYHKREDDAHSFATFSEWLARHYRPGSEVEHTLLMARISNEAGDYEACLERVAPYLDGRKEGLARDQCLLMAGVSCAKLNRPGEAKTHLSRLLAEHPGSELRPKAMLLLGWMALVDGDEKTAAERMNDILREYPKDPVADKARQLLQGIEARRERKKTASGNERETF